MAIDLTSGAGRSGSLAHMLSRSPQRVSESVSGLSGSSADTGNEPSVLEGGAGAVPGTVINAGGCLSRTLDLLPVTSGGCLLVAAVAQVEQVKDILLILVVMVVLEFNV